MIRLPDFKLHFLERSPKYMDKNDADIDGIMVKTAFITVKLQDVLLFPYRSLQHKQASTSLTVLKMDVVLRPWLPNIFEILELFQK